MKLLVFGPTGVTGQHLVRLALVQRHTVRAFARTPSKLPSHIDLEPFQGDVTDRDSVERALDGVDAVFCAVKNREASAGGAMTTFMKWLVEGMRTRGIRRLVYQAGAFSPTPDETRPTFIRSVVRPIFGRITGAETTLSDNDQLIRYMLAEVPDLDWIITRVGAIREGDSRGTLKVSAKPGLSVRSVDVAASALELLQGAEHLRTCPYVAY